MIIDTYCIHSSVCRVCLFFCVHTVQGGWAQVYLLLSVPFTLCLDSKMPLFLPGSKKKTKSSFGGKRVLCATSPLMDKPHTPSPLLMQLGIGPISPTTWQSLQTFQHDPKSFCFVGIHCMLKNGKCATAAIAPQPRISLLCHRKYSWIFRNIPPSKLHNGTNGTHFHSNFLLILLDRLGHCASKLSIRCGIVVLCLGWTTLHI